MNEVAPDSSLVPLTQPVLEARADSGPLRSPKEERYARLRAILCPKAEAYRMAGYTATTDQTAVGNASRLEARKRIQKRIAELSRQPEEIWQAKRRRLEEELWRVALANVADIWETRPLMVPVKVPVLDGETGEPVLGKNGKPLWEQAVDDNGEPLWEHEIGRDGKPKYYQRLKLLSELPEDLQRAVQSIEYDESGRLKCTMYSKLSANSDLRKMLGIGTIDLRDGDGEFDRLGDQELLSELRRQATELGIDVELTYRIAG